MRDRMHSSDGVSLVRHRVLYFNHMRDKSRVTRRSATNWTLNVICDGDLRFTSVPTRGSWQAENERTRL